MSLVCSGVGYSYGRGGRRAVSDVDLSLDAGSLLVVVGTSGSGKSTLLRLIAGLIEPEVGSISIDGEAPRAGTVGYAFQSPELQLFADTVIEDVMFGPQNRGLGEKDARHVAEHALQQVGLGRDVGERSPFRLSGGMKRRVALAGVLAMDASAYVFDEPLVGLDGAGIEAVVPLIAGLRDEGRHVVVATHDLERFLPIADGVLVLADGSIAWSGSSEGFAHDPDVFRAAADVLTDDMVYLHEVRRLGTEAGA